MAVPFVDLNAIHEPIAAEIDGAISNVLKSNDFIKSETVANFEQKTLTDVIEARSKATSITLKAEDLTPENMAKFQAAQDQLKGSLSRLLVVAEQYPQLKATENFTKLQGQLEGIENDVKTSRNTFNEAINSYNVKVRSFPMNILAGMFGFKAKEGFKADAGTEKAPEVKF